MRTALSATALGAAAMVLTVGVAPLMAVASDHLDAPNLGSISVSGSDQLSVSKVNGPLDIADLYVFKGATADHTALILTVNPAVNLGIGPSAFTPGAEYAIEIDRNGNSKPDLAYVLKFGAPALNGAQHYVVLREEGDDRVAVAQGWTGVPTWTDGLGTFVGMRSDPFFFDLLGFLGTVKHEGTRRLDDGKQADFFARLDIQAIVLEVPDAQLGGDGRNIGVWGVTRKPNGVRADQVGRPAINTVFNATAADKEAFNQTSPDLQPTALGGRFRTNVINTLEAFSGLDSEGSYTAAQAATLADILLPDELRYTVGTTAAGPLDGRNLSDDVIDIELNIVTGGFPFAGRDASGAIATDGIGAHADYLSSFPYLGVPH